MKTLTQIDEKVELEKVQSNNAPLIHLSPLVKYFGIPFGGILSPLITWHIWKDKSEFEDFHGKEALNFNLSFLMYKFILIIIGGVFLINPLITVINEFKNSYTNPITLFFSIPNMMFLGIMFVIFELIWFILIIIAAVKSGNGELYKYPFIIRFIK